MPNATHVSVSEAYVPAEHGNAVTADTD
jgi:hypothetical protein